MGTRQRTVDTPSVTLTGLTNSTEYTLRVRASNAGGDSDWSEGAAGTPQVSAPERPGPPDVTPGDGTLELTWPAVAGADSYTVQWRSGAQEYSGTRQRTVVPPQATLSGLTKRHRVHVAGPGEQRRRRQRLVRGGGGNADDTCSRAAAGGRRPARFVAGATRPSAADLSVAAWCASGADGASAPPRTRRAQGRRGRLASPHGGVVTLWFGSRARSGRRPGLVSASTRTPSAGCRRRRPPTAADAWSTPSSSGSCRTTSFEPGEVRVSEARRHVARTAAGVKMDTTLAPTRPAAAGLERPAPTARRLAEASISPNTRRAPGSGGTGQVRRGGRARGAEGDALPERGAGGAPADRTGAAAARRPGDDQAAGGRGGAARLDVLPHVPGDGDHGVSVERGDPRARSSRSPGTRRRKRRSSTTGRRTRSPLTRSSGSCSDARCRGGADGPTPRLIGMTPGRPA